MDWDDLRYFLAVARHGSLSAAARALKVTQSTVGRRLAAFEASAHAQLLQRTPAGHVLTPAGRAVLDTVERMERDADAIERRIAGHDDRLEGVIRVTTTPSLAAEALAESFAVFRDRYPEILLDVIVDPRAYSLDNREADVAIRLSRPTREDIIIRKAVDLKYAVYASTAYLARYGAPDIDAGADGHRFIAPPDDQAEFAEYRWLLGPDPAGRINFRSNGRFSQIRAAELGMGLVLLERYLGDARPALVRLAEPPTPPREIWIAVPRDIHAMPRIRRLTEHLVESLHRQSERFSPAD